MLMQMSSIPKNKNKHSYLPYCLDNSYDVVLCNNTTLYAKLCVINLLFNMCMCGYVPSKVGHVFCMETFDLAYNRRVPYNQRFHCRRDPVFHTLVMRYLILLTVCCGFYSGLFEIWSTC